MARRITFGNTPGIRLGGLGGTTRRGSDLKGYVTWRVPPEVLAQAVAEAGERLVRNIDYIMTNGAKGLQEVARGLASDYYVVQTPRAAKNLTASRESPTGFAGGRGFGGTFRIYLYHGPRTRSNKGYYYGQNLERQANQHGRYGHQTEVIMPSINRFGPHLMRAMRGALINNLSPGSNTLARINSLNIGGH